MERGRVGETQQECDLAVTEPVVREVAAGVLIAHLVEQSAEGGAVLQALQRLLIARSRPSRRRSSANVATTKVNRIIPFQNGKAPYRKRSIAESSRTNAGEQPHQREQPDPELGVRRADAERVECAGVGKTITALALYRPAARTNQVMNRMTSASAPPVVPDNGKPRQPAGRTRLRQSGDGACINQRMTRPAI